MSLKLGIKDLRIMRELDKNPDITTSQLAKKALVSQQVADYRLKNLLKNKVIVSITPMIDFCKLGYTLFRILIRFKSISKEKKKEFEEFVFENYKCFFIGALGGKWDCYFDLFAVSSLEFQINLTEIISKFPEIQDYETLTITRIHVFNYKYILPESSASEFIFQEIGNEKIDEKDKKILEIIKSDSRMPYLRVASKVRLTRNAVKERIKKLQKFGVIAKNRIILNPNMLGRESYKILFKLKASEREKQKLIENVKFNRNVIYALELMGSYQLDLEIEIENREKLQEFLIDLRNNFAIIQDYEITSLFYDSGIDFFPISKK